MFGFGTVLNVAGIVCGGIIGLTFGKKLPERFQDSIGKACGVSVLFIGISGALSGMLSVTDGTITSGQSMLVVLSLVLGTLFGELVDLDTKFEQFGEWLKRKTGNAKDIRFVDGFVTASLTVCIGAMAVVGSIQDGLTGDYSILATKSVLDTIIILVMTCSLGKGCIFSAIPVGVFQGCFTLAAKLIQPVMTDAALASLSMVGSILIFCVGINLVFGKTVKVANFLPSLIPAVILTFTPFF